jgi:4-diphosphocytidyl-2C-methyl-D-erythritol kinase
MDRVEEIAALLRERVDGMTLAATTAMLREANDLWAPAARRSPGLAAVRETATRVLGRSVLLTGSGPTLFAVYPSEAAAIIAAVTLRTECPHPLKGTTILTTSTTGRGESQ